MRRVAIEPSFEAFRNAARPLLANDTPPQDIFWEDAVRGQSILFDDVEVDARRSVPGKSASRVSSRALELVRLASFHEDPERFALFYRIFFRLTHGEPHLLEVASDPDVSRLRSMVQAIRHDEHKMHAFVRFRRVDVPDEREPWFVAWYRPDHPILQLTAPFFERRFASMQWAILTPIESVYWDKSKLRFGPGVAREDAPPEDAFEEMFRTYYRAIFNPARVNLEAMRAEMPKKFWVNMPETRVLHELVRDSELRVEAMKAPETSASDVFVPATRSLPLLAAALRECRACDLYEHATQPVFGEPTGDALTSLRLMLVGEQPGDAEDLRGRPFVGPAGKVLDDALKRAGIDRASVYVTNAVKHFKFQRRGKRRMHQRPVYEEVKACRGWLDAELAAIKPDVIVCLGSTAAQSFFGKRFQLTKRRGQLLDKIPWARALVATWHPAAILRATEPEIGRRMFEELVTDLILATSTTREK